MDFTNRNSSTQPQPTFPPAPGTHGNAGPMNRHHRDKESPSGWRSKKLYRIGAVILYLCTVALIVAAILTLVFNKTADRESSFVDSSKYQAVFLNNGQVYFGHLDGITQQYMNLKNIYYLQSSSNGSSSSSAKNSVTLVKLGCELHAPEDQMIIQTSQVSFWENLQDSGQVVQAIKKLPKCTPTTPPASQSNNAGVPSSSSNSSSSSKTTGTNDNTAPNATTNNTPSTTNTTPSKQTP